MDALATATPPTGTAIRPCTSAPAVFTGTARRRDLENAYPELAAYCDQLGFGWHHELQQWCEEPSWMLVELARCARPPAPANALDWSLATLPELVDEIVTHHHRPLRNELSRLSLLIDELNHRWPDAVVGLMAQRFASLRDTLLAHLEQEEHVVFPLGIALDKNVHGDRSASPTDATAAIRFMSLGHVLAHTQALELDATLTAVAQRIDDPDVVLVREALAALRHNFVRHDEIEDDILLPAMIHASDLVHSRHAGHSGRQRVAH